jgi:MraZ protein
MSELSKAPYFYGSFENRLNSKGQVAIPKRFRTVVPADQVEAGFVLVQGGEECVYMYTHNQFGEVKARVRAIAVEEDDPEFFRSFMESAHAVDLDSQGRFVLPVGLREKARIVGPDVLFIGMDDRIEIWEPSLRNKVARDDSQEKRKIEARRIFGI